MHDELYNTVMNELDAIPTKFFDPDPDMALEQREEARIAYNVEYKKICEQHGVTEDQIEKEMLLRLDSQLGARK